MAYLLLTDEHRNLLREGSDDVLDIEQMIHVVLPVNSVHDIPWKGVHEAVCVLRELL